MKGEQCADCPELIGNTTFCRPMQLQAPLPRLDPCLLEPQKYREFFEGQFHRMSESPPHS